MGAFWSLVMAGLFGFSQLASRKGLRGMAVDQGTFVMIAVSTALLVIPFVWVGGPQLVAQAEPVSLAYFVAAGLLHFVFGFSFMNFAISRIGAARAGSLMATTPLFATLLAALMLGEALGPLLMLGVLLVTLGVWLISAPPWRVWRRRAADDEQLQPGGDQHGQWLPAAAALLAALSWGVSPVLIKAGMQTVPSPVAGVTLSTASAGLVYAVGLHARGQLVTLFEPSAPRAPLAWQIASGTLVGLGTLCRWIALSLASAALVTTLSRASLLVTVGLGSRLLGRELEPVSRRVIWGALLIAVGSLAVVWFEQT